MATKKKRKPRRRTGSDGSTQTGAAPPRSPGASGANPDRRERKEEARRAREAERKRAKRAALLRRGVYFAGVTAVAIGVLFFFQRAASPRPVPEAAIQAAEIAGCSTIETPASSAPGSQHLEAGAGHAYDQHPATSGLHDPAPMPIPPHVYDAPIPETKAVHNLEHGAVILYYRQSGDALSAAKMARLTAIAKTSDNVILAPYEGLPDDSALALTAWNKLQTCPSSASGPQITTIARGFIEGFVCSSNAPEGKQGQGC
jgi:hypothetical protein